MKRFLLLAFLVAASVVFAGTLTLKSGETLDGKVTGAGKDGAVVEKDGVPIRVDWDFVEPSEAVKIWEAGVSWSDTKALADLAEFAETKGLPDTAKKAWEGIIKVEADHEAARAALGYVKKGAEWVLAAAEAVTPKPLDPVGVGQAPADNLAVPAGISKEAIAADSRGNAILEEAKKNPKSSVEQSELACIEFRKAIKAAKNFALAWYHLGIAYQFTKDYQEACGALEQAIKINPFFFEAYVELGDAWAWLRNEDKAVQHYKKAIEINPKYALAWRNTAMIELKRRHLTEAKAACESAAALDTADGFTKQLLKMVEDEIKGPGFGDAEIRKKSKHFEVITNGSQFVADTMSEHLENIYAVYGKVFPKIEKDDLIFPVIVYKNNQDYMAGGAPPGTGGYFSPMVKKLVFYWMGDTKIQDTLMVLYHETFHAFLDYYLEDATQWFNEGHGDYFGAWKWDENSKRMNCRTNWWRLGVIKSAIEQNRFTPLKELLQMTQQEMYNPQIVSINYAEAWSIVYFMWTYGNGKYTAVLRNYFFELQKGAGIRRAYNNTFGKIDMNRFESEWKTYIKSLENPPGVLPPNKGPGR